MNTITTKEAMMLINEAILKNGSSSKIIAAAAAVITSRVVCYNTPYNPDTNSYQDDKWYRLEEIDTIENGDYFSVQYGENVFANDPVQKQLVEDYVQYYRNNIHKSKSITVPAGYGGTMDYSDIKIGSHPIELQEEYVNTHFLNIVVEEANSDSLRFHFVTSVNISMSTWDDVTYLYLLDNSRLLKHKGVYIK